MKMKLGIAAVFIALLSIFGATESYAQTRVVVREGHGRHHYRRHHGRTVVVRTTHRPVRRHRTVVVRTTHRPMHHRYHRHYHHR